MPAVVMVDVMEDKAIMCRRGASAATHGMLQDGLILATDNNTGLTPQTGHLI